VAGHGEKQSRLREIAISALLTEPTIPEAAKKAGVHERTLYRWLQDEEFKNEYNKAKRQLVDQALNYMQAITGTAIRKLNEIIEADDTPPNVKVSAIKTLLDNVVKIREVEELEKEIEEIRQQLGMKDVS